VWAADLGEGGADDLGAFREGRGRKRRSGPTRSGARPAARRLPTLRRCGLSERKAEYVRRSRPALSPAARSTRPNSPRSADEELVARLTDVKGIGRWTAEMFLMFHEMRPNVFPADDIGIQRAVAVHYNDGERMELAVLRGIRRALASRIAALRAGTCGARSTRFPSNIEARLQTGAGHEQEGRCVGQACGTRPSREGPAGAQGEAGQRGSEGAQG
jgi:hypothetical protein